MDWKRLGPIAAIATLSAALAHAAALRSPAGQLAIGELTTYVTRQADTLADVAQHYDLGYTQLVVANPAVDPWLPGAGRAVVIPSYYLLPDAPHVGIVVNLAEQRLFYFPPGNTEVQTFPVGIGREALTTPLGVTRVVGKERAPSWIPPQSIRAERPDLPPEIRPGPDNPLGAYALRLGWPNYLIHGTNKPDGVGRSVSHGCLHLYPWDIKKVFAEVSIGTPVRVVDQRVEVAWIGDQLFLEVHPNQEEADAIDIGIRVSLEPPPDLVEQVTAAAGSSVDRVDWAAVQRAGLEESGIPTPVLRAAAGPAVAAVTETPL
jgi:L,D-transpeptidase ErfK/SrfK